MSIRIVIRWLLVFGFQVRGYLTFLYEIRMQPSGVSTHTHFHPMSFGAVRNVFV